MSRLHSWKWQFKGGKAANQSGAHMCLPDSMIQICAETNHGILTPKNRIVKRMANIISGLRWNQCSTAWRSHQTTRRNTRLSPPHKDQHFACASVINDVTVMMLHCLWANLQHDLGVNCGIFPRTITPLRVHSNGWRYDCSPMHPNGSIAAVYCFVSFYRVCVFKTTPSALNHHTHNTPNIDCSPVW